MLDTAVPHISLALSPGDEARQLGPMTKRGVNNTDWQDCGISVDPHSCSVAVAKELRTRPDLETKPLPAGRIFFTDGCCFRSKAGPLQAAAAVVEFSGGKFITLTAQTLTVKPSAQAAEVLALCLALEAASGEQVTVYSDSAYAVSAALLDLAAWKRNSYLTARGEPIAHKDLMQRLDHALQMPSRVAVVKVPGHSKGNSLTTKGNNAADAAAKAAAGSADVFLPQSERE
uniref:ribonuclease H n=1 Tax=Oryzias latipes TaxID=8090 RepID=A0A3B3HTC1_ORYLA